MSLHVTTSILKSYGPGLRVRDDSGNAKVILFGGTKRVRIPSASIKYVVRRLIGGDEIRSASLGRFITRYVYSQAEKGNVPEEEKVDYAKKICGAIGCKYVDLDKEKKAESEDSKKEKDEKGNTIIVMEAHTLEQVCNGLIDHIKETQGKIAAAEESLKDKNLSKEDKENLKKQLKAMEASVKDAGIEAVANEIFEENPVAITQALFGIMSTGGVTKTMYGAVKMSQMYSIDRYAGDRDFWIAKHQSREIICNDAASQKEVDFFDELNAFTSEERKKVNAETLDEVDIYANTMYGNMTVDLRCLFDNLNENAKTEAEKTSNVEVAAAATAEVIMHYMLANPSANQTTQASNPAPEIAYIEVVRNGNLCTPEFADVLKPGVKTIVEQGIEKILEFAEDTTFRTGKINRYVLLPASRKEYRKVFEEAGITVLSGLDEMQRVIREEATDIISNL